ncbi:MAG: MlaD family protein [Geminicoccaceae bacterium]
MSVRRNATAVGAFVLGAMAIAVAIAIVFGSGLLFKSVSRYVVFFEDSLEGLSVGAPVKFRGVQIGQVVSITPSFTAKERMFDIPVVVELTKGSVQGLQDGVTTLQELIAAGLRARLELTSLITGQLYVDLNLDPDTPAVEVTNATGYPQIPSLPSLQYGLQQTLNNLLADRPKIEKGLDQTLELLNLMVAGGGAEQITRTMAAATQLLEKLSDPQGSLFKTLDGLPPLMEDVGRAAAAAPPLMVEVDQTLRTVNGLTAGPDAPVARTLADLQASLADLRKLGNQLSALVAQTRAPVAAFAQTGLPSLQGLIQDMDRAVGEISRTVRDLRQNPARFLLGDPASEGVRLQ